MTYAMRHSITLICLCLALGLAACRPAMAERPIKPVSDVDLSRYMGRWYVLASIPTRFERNAYAAVESYRLEPDGDIDTSFRFHRGAFDGPRRTIDSTATVVPGSGNGEWQVHFLRVLRAQYIVGWLAPDY